MFASGDIRFPAPLTADREADLTLTVADVRLRSGKSGDLVFVDVERRIVQDGRDCVVERQTLVYRDAGASMPTVVPTADPPGETGDAEIWTPGAVDLFRFSAATGNAHRIHYDADYTRTEEGYPDLVVHGPFTAARLFARLSRQLGAPPTHFTFRAHAPLIVSQPIRLVRGDTEQEACAVRCDGVTAMTAEGRP